jgi:hypothetical protein
MSGGEYWGLVTDTGDWLWGLIQGGFNEQQSVSQIIVDACIGMIPVVGDVTAVRDVLAVTIRLADDPAKRQEVMQWVELVIGLLALIPVAGGAIKGVGKLLMRVGKNAADHAKILREAIELLHRLGNGNAVKYIRELDLTRHTAELQRHFRSVIGRLTTTIDAIIRRASLLLPAGMKTRLQQLKAALNQLLALGDRMIPDAVKELNARLKTIQRHMYDGNWHEIPSSLRSNTREFERGLIRSRRLPNPSELPHPPSTIADYPHDPHYPDLSKSGSFHNNTANPLKTIRSFSGKIEPHTVKPGTTIYRVIEDVKDRAGGFWTLEKPANGVVWRDEWAVLESWNKDGLYVEFKVPPAPPGKDGLKAWKGTVSSQVERDAAKATYGQVLKGGETQLVIDLYDPINKWAQDALAKCMPKATGWTGHLGLNVPSEEVRAILLGQAERAERVGQVTAVTRVTGAAARGAQAEEKQAK